MTEDQAHAGPLAELVATEHRTYVTVHDGDTVVFDADVSTDPTRRIIDTAADALEGGGWRVTSTWAQEQGGMFVSRWTARVEVMS